MGLAAIYRIRGEGGWYDAREVASSVEKQLGAEFIELFYYFNNHRLGYDDEDREFTLSDPGRTTCTDVDDVLQSIIQAGMDDVKEEADRDSYNHLIEEFTSNENRRRCLGWLRKGYRRTVKRYGWRNPYDLSYLFTTIEEKLFEKEKYLEVYEGTVVSVNVDVKNLEVNVKWPYG